MTTSMDSDVVLSLPPRRRLTIPELLACRQLKGVPRRPRSTDRVTASQLSSAIAWNTCRMQNMIVAVGPGTPAAIAARNIEGSSSSSSSSSEEQEEVDHDDDEEKAHEESDDQMEESDNANERRQESRFREGHRAVETLLNTDDPRHAELAERVLLALMGEDEDDDEEESEEEDISNGNFATSIRHGGCINTATWLTSPWRLSVPGHNSSVAAHDSYECPTQLITSGDDRHVKFWDVRHAMGTTSPLPIGSNLDCPFADIAKCSSYDWINHDFNELPLPGSVIPLATLPTDHHGNIFHVTPVDHQPGKVVTCAADGYLRMIDVHQSSGSSTIIVSPEYAHDDMSDLLPAGLLSMRSGMCFSHHFLNANTGLLCSERGLTRFDVRLPPREQSARSLLGTDKSCKCCAIWSASSPSSEDMDSAYVFGKSPGARLSFPLLTVL